LFVKTHREWEAAGGEDTEYIFSTYDDAFTAQELLTAAWQDSVSNVMYESFIDEVVPPQNTYRKPEWLQERLEAEKLKLKDTD
jgi:hypothetical protein